MSISIVDIFKVGIGPSSSHTMGPMRAAERFTLGLAEKKLSQQTKRVLVELYGSLALTGIGHGTNRAVILGLEGNNPELIDPDYLATRHLEIAQTKRLNLAGKFEITFNEKTDLKYHRRKSLPIHPNGMRFTAFDHDQNEIYARVYYSIGGGFVVNEETAEQDRLKKDKTKLKFAFSSADQLLAICKKEKKSIADIMLANEGAWRPENETIDYLHHVMKAMGECIDRGYKQTGLLPGHLKVARRANKIWNELTSRPETTQKDPLSILDWVNLYALSVNEENASGSRVVTAPTNGAAGIIPATLRYYERFCDQRRADGKEAFLLTAGAIGLLYATNASISGAEVGCQGEVGVACSMAAGGLTAALGGTNEQIEQAAEIGMEHNLGLTCDPVGGLVQIPCIERNAMGAVKAINASRIALRGDGTHYVSLDSVIKTMQQTGKDMMTKYKETSRGGLAVNVIEC